MATTQVLKMVFATPFNNQVTLSLNNPKDTLTVAEVQAVMGAWPNRGVKTYQRFYVLVYTDMPAVLTENGFIDHIEDARKLCEPTFRKNLARAHTKGICDYFGVEYWDPHIKIK